jgi:hypothetical protein
LLFKADYNTAAGNLETVYSFTTKVAIVFAQIIQTVSGSYP